jgi:hypothetical protein
VGRAAKERQSPPSIKDQGCISGGRARKVVKLNLGDLACVREELPCCNDSD